MRSCTSIILAVCAVATLAVPAVQADSGGVVRFASLPKPGAGFPEGLAADGQGNIYAASSDSSQPNVIYVFGGNGRLRATMPLPAGTVPLGMAFDAAGNLFAADIAGGRILEFAPPFGPASTPVATFAVCGGAGAGCGLNGLAFDAAGDLFVSDSFGGQIFKVEQPGGAVSVFFSDERLRPGSHGFPPFGANGIAFDAAGTDLFVANTADDRIFRLDLATMTLVVFAESINGADGIAFAGGRLWVAANQEDTVVALDARGRVVERRGSFEGIRSDGSPKGLLFPASLALSGEDLFVTNLALPLTAAVGDEPEEDVTTFTISRLPQVVEKEKDK